MRKLFYSKILVVLSVAVISIFLRAEEPGKNNSVSKLKIYVYPSLIYDSGCCTIYRKHLTKLMFLCYYQGERILDLGTTTKLQIDLPKNLKIEFTAIMDSWKKGGKVSDKFAVEKVSDDNMVYRRWTVPLPNHALRELLKKPLPGGAFGGISHNFVNVFVKPTGEVPKKFKIRWRTAGKYPDSGEFSVSVMDLPSGTPNPKRIKLRSQGPLANLGNPKKFVEDLTDVYREVGVKWIDGQFDSGPNRGWPKIWETKKFKFYGGGGFLGTLMKYSLKDRTASNNLEDYLVGLDGKRCYGANPKTYNYRIWCPEAVITRGRHPWKLNINTAKAEAEVGAVEIDADFEIHAWDHCYCPVCLDAFAKFANIPFEKLQKLRPEQIVRKYPVQWFKFRCNQTRKLYAILKKYLNKNYPGVKIGVNASMQDMEYDMGDLKYGICNFGEDPRLMGDAIDYILLDTLTGSLRGSVIVDVIRKTTNKPIISVVGCSYCVGFSPHCMAGRRMTADLTGDDYGYERRCDLMKLGMIHHAASGASGLRFEEIKEPLEAIRFDEAAAILAKVEDWYLDGNREDKQIEIIDLTSSPSPWLKDKSRVGGGIWRYFYEQYHGQVQFRVHSKNGEILVSLFNWDPHQDKEWLVRLKPELAKPFNVIDIVNNKTILHDNEILWSVDELTKGIPVTVPAAGFRILLFSEKPVKTDGNEKISSTIISKALKDAENRQPHDQYAWYTGKQIDIKKYVDKRLKRPLDFMKKYGGLRQ